MGTWNASLTRAILYCALRPLRKGNKADHARGFEVGLPPLRAFALRTSRNGILSRRGRSTGFRRLTGGRRQAGDELLRRLRAVALIDPCLEHLDRRRLAAC